MRRLLTLFVVLSCLASGLAAQAVSGRVIKVLPLYLDQKGREALSPSLYERDAYQAQLLRHPKQRSGLRLAVQWKAKDAAQAHLKLRVELRGAKKGGEPSPVVLEQAVQQRGLFSHWTDLALLGKDYQQFGELVAWRATLWDGDQMLGEQKSFLW